MSLEKKSIHVRLDPVYHRRLDLMADFSRRDMAELASQWLEKAIVAEFHEFTLAAERWKRLGLAGTEGDSKGFIEKHGGGKP
jgi:hypothetical protein